MPGDISRSYKGPKDGRIPSWMNKMKPCCLCGKEIEYGHNPWPLKIRSDPTFGDCCDDCNRTKVWPARLALAKQEEDNVSE